VLIYDGFCVETLDIRNMIRDAKKKHKRFMTRSIYDVSWFEFLRVLDYKCLWKGKRFQKIDQFFASTQTCPFCGHVQKEITLDDRVLICPNCEIIMERDSRSSLTILNEGIRLLKIPKEPGELKTVGENAENIFDESVISSVSSKLDSKVKAFASS
jgi:IS605 OrfB family transposase